MEMGQQVLPGFKRLKRVGFNVLGFSETKKTLFVRVMEIGVFKKKDGDEIDFADVVNLETGEEQRMWLDGGLRYAFSELTQTNQLPFPCEITWKGKSPAQVVIEGKKQETLVNQYEVILLEESDAEEL